VIPPAVRRYRYSKCIQAYSPTFFSRRRSAQNSSSAGLGQNFYVWGLMGKSFKRGEGLRSDEEKEAHNGSGMEVALGVYPYVQ
jgi:hypothetical protein